MFEKKIAAKSVEPINSDKPKFPKGTKFTLDGKMWLVTEEMFSDNTEMRRTVSDIGEEVILTLETLRKDMKDKSFAFVEN